MNGERNTELLCFAAARLAPLLDQLTFVGGITTALHITDRTAADVRATEDVDAIVDAVTVVDYQRFSAGLRKLGFREDTETGLICRWRYENLSLDVVPVDPRILGFGNDWYAEAVASAVTLALTPSLTIRVTPAPYFIATKFCAFRDRGNGDFLMSHDLEDIITVIDGRPELFDELSAASLALHEFVAAECRRLLETPGFLDALPGLVIGAGYTPARVITVENRLRKLADSVADRSHAR